MILGFISLSLIGFEDAIMTICVPLSISQCGVRRPILLLSWPLHIGLCLRLHRAW